jgi:hypothetical protein
MLVEECASDDPGKDLMLRRMLDALLIEALRSHDVGEDGVVAGLLNGLRDPALAARFRRSMQTSAGWTAGLAVVAGMSRSAFSARFGEDHGLRTDRISGALAHGDREGGTRTGYQVARSDRRRDRL